MPFLSEKQRAWMWATNPKMARRWEAETPKGRSLPKRVKPKKKPAANVRVTNASSSSNALRKDPTKTVTLRRQFTTALRKPYRQFKKDLVDLVKTQDAFGNGRWAYESMSRKLERFGEWLGEQIDERLDVQSQVRQHVAAALKRGMSRSYDDARRKKKRGRSTSFSEGSKEQFIRMVAGRRDNSERTQLLTERVLSEVDGATGRMTTKLLRTVADALAREEEIEERIEELIAAVEDAESSLGLIARTETIRSYAEGQLNALEELGIEGVLADIEYSVETAGDGRVCPLCEEIEGQVLSIDEARGRIPLHPGCRCAWTIGP